MSGGPHVATRHVADVTEVTRVVACGIFAPTSHRKSFPLAVASPCIRHHDVIATVRQEMDFRNRRLRRGEDANQGVSFIDRLVIFGGFRRVRIERRDLGNSLLQQQVDRLKIAIGLEPLLHRAVQQQVGEREEAHPLMVRHIRANDGMRLSA